MLAIAPERVRLDRAEAGDRRPIGTLLPLLRAHGVRAVSANGVLGDPAGATAGRGSPAAGRRRRRVSVDTARGMADGSTMEVTG